MSTSSPSSHSGHRPTIIENYHSHTHNNNPVVYPYKPDKQDPPGAFLYRDVWVVFKAGVQCFLAACEPKTYGLGFAVGALKAGYHWSEMGPPKKLDIDSEIKDFGGAAHSSTIASQLAILAENLLAVWLPVKLQDYAATEQNSFKDIKGLSTDQNAWLKEQHRQNQPMNFFSYLRHGFIGYQAITTGEDFINQIARWADKK